MSDTRDDQAGRRQSRAQQRSDSGLRTAPYRRRRNSAAARRLVPLAFLLLVGLLIAHNEIPAFAQWWERMVAPRELEAKQLCQQAALGQVSRPAFARVVEPGRVHRTEDGLYVDRLVLGEMGESGAEQAVEYSCYLDSDGRLVRVNRL
jgi:hypothetical protein